MSPDHDLIITTVTRRPLGMALALKTMYETVVGQTLALDMTETLLYHCHRCLDQLQDYERGSVSVPMPDGTALVLLFATHAGQYTIETLAPLQSPVATAWVQHFGHLVQLDRVVEETPCAGA